MTEIEKPKPYDLEERTQTFEAVEKCSARF
jgi:hypothetical protein